LIIGPDRDKWAKELLDHVDNRVSVYLTENGQRIIEESLVRFRGSKRSFMTSVPGLIEKQRREVGSADGSRKTNFVNVMHSTISSFRRLRR
jgi:hypothetical protein